MFTRLVIAMVVAVLNVPIILLGFIDPLEGGIALVVAAGVAAVVWLVSAVAPPRLAWISWLVTMAVGVSAIAYVMWGPAAQESYGGNGLLSLPPLLVGAVLAWIAGVGITLFGWAEYIVRLGRRLRHEHRVSHHA